MTIEGLGKQGESPGFSLVSIPFIFGEFDGCQLGKCLSENQDEHFNSTHSLFKRSGAHVKQRYDSPVKCHMKNSLVNQG